MMNSRSRSQSRNGGLGKPRKNAPRASSQQGSRTKSRGEPPLAESTYITPQQAFRLQQTKNKSMRVHAPECICTICECGQHKCPPDRLSGKYNNLQTSYMSDFKGAYAPPSRPVKAQYIHRPRPFSGTTTNQEDYNYKGMPQRRASSKVKDNGLGSIGVKFEGETTNHHDFQRWNGRPAVAVQRAGLRAEVPDDRDFRTEFATQFTFPVGGARRRSRAPVSGNFNSIPFSAVTTNQDDFKQWKHEPSAMFVRQQKYQPRDEDREFSTECRSEYTKKPLDYCPAREVAITSKPENGHVAVEPLGDHWVHKDMPGDWEPPQRNHEAQGMEGIF